jgi:RNA polymerase sigma-70 factor (ECF subfamily)
VKRRNAQQRTDDLDGLYRELYPSLVRFSQGIVGSRSDAEDAVHDAFVAAVRTAPAEDPRPWLFRVTRNASIDLLRRRKPMVPMEAVEAHLPATGSIDPHASAVRSEQLALMRAGLDALPERGRTAILLRELGGLPYSEIGQVLDTTEGNVKVLIFRARASLHELTEATQLDCESVRTTLSAAADGEAGLAERARAQLHSAHCHSCRTFTDSIGSQRVAIVALVPLFAAPHALGMTGGGSVLGGGITGMKAALAGMLAAATVGVSAGGVAVWNPSHAHPAPSHIAAAVGPSSTTAGDAREQEQSADAAEPAEAPETPVSAGDTAETGDKTGTDTQSDTASGQSTQFAAMIEPDDGAGPASVATTTTHRTATQHESEAVDNPHQPGSVATRDT